MVEAPGVEPGSENASERATTRVAILFGFDPGGGGWRPSAGASPSCVSPADRQTLSAGQPDGFGGRALQAEAHVTVAA